MDVVIQNRHHRFNLPDKKILAAAGTILEALGYPEAQLSIVIVDDDQIAELNATYLDHAGPTNVISFPMQEGEFVDITPTLLGDVVISADTAHREALSAGMALEERLYELLIHGILHLVGYDHVNSQAEAMAMARKSDALMALIGRKDQAW